MKKTWGESLFCQSNKTDKILTQPLNDCQHFGVYAETLRVFKVLAVAKARYQNLALTVEGEVSHLRADPTRTTPWV